MRHPRPSLCGRGPCRLLVISGLAALIVFTLLRSSLPIVPGFRLRVRPTVGGDDLAFLHPHEEHLGGGWDWKGMWKGEGKPLLLVTGGAGQLGHAIIPRLSEDYTVHVLDIASRPATLAQSESIIYHRGSVLPPSTVLPTLLRSNAFRGIIHLAAVSLEDWCAPNERNCLKVNEGGTRSILAQLDKTKRNGASTGLPWMIHASSIEVFEAGQEEGLPKTALGRTKLAAEKAVVELARQKGIDALVLRFGEIYGYPPSSAIPQSFTSALLANAISSTPIQFSSDAPPLDLLHLDDAVEGVLAGVTYMSRRSEQEGVTAAAQAIDLVAGQAWTQEELVERVRTESGSMSPLRDIGNRNPASAMTLRNSVASELLGWQPRITLQDGIRSTLADITQSIATWSREYHSSHCAPTADFPSVDGRPPKLAPDERNKDLWKLDGCTVNVAFDHEGWLHHLKCDDGQHCVADGQKVVAMNWNSSVFVLHRISGRKNDRKVGVMFEEEKGTGWLGIAEGGREYGETGLELFQLHGARPAHLEFDLEVATDSSYLRLSLPNGHQVHAVANVSASTTWFSLEAPNRLGRHFDMRMNVLCCPSQGDWPLLLDDYESADTRFGSTGQIPFNSSRRTHTCKRSEEAVRYNAERSRQIREGTAAKRSDTAWQPHQWAIKDLPTCWNDCDSPVVCVQTGDCRCVPVDCPPRRDNPLLGLKPPSTPNAGYSPLGVHKGYSGTLIKATERMDWQDVLLPQARAYLAAHPDFIKVHVADGYEGQEAIEAAKCHQLQDTHCFSADNIMYRAMRHISVPAEEAELVVLPVYQHCTDADFLLHDVMNHAVTTIPGINTGEKRVSLIMTHDWGICIAFAWEIWSARDHHTLYPDWILDNVLVMSVMGDYDSPCYRPHQDVVVPARTCQSKSLRDTFPTIEQIKPAAERTSLVTWAGTYWGTGKSERVRLTCHRGGAGAAPLVRGGGPKSNWASWHYMDDLTNSRFCPQPRGIAGWSPRTNDAIYAGCIPVIIAEGSHYPFADFLDWSKFSVKISPTELDSVEQILEAIPMEKVEQMQANLALVRDAFIYSGDEHPEEEIGRRGPMFFALHEAGMRMRTEYPTEP